MPKPRPVFEIILDENQPLTAVTISNPSPWLSKTLKLIDDFEAAIEETMHRHPENSSKIHKTRILLVSHLKARDDRA